MRRIQRIVSGILLAVLLLTMAPAALAADKPVYATKPKASYWNFYKADLHYFYNQLNTEEKRYFSCLYDAIAFGDVNLWNTANLWDNNSKIYQELSSREVNRVVYTIRHDCPELMITFNQIIDMSKNPRVELLKHSKKIQSYLDGSKKVLNQIKKRSDWGNSTFDHQLAYDRYIVKNCSYLRESTNDVNNQNNNIRAGYSVFTTKKAVCEGYARSTQLAMRYYGMHCIFVTGEAGEGHAWNLVKQNGKWYQYDPTWQDSDNKQVFADYLPLFNVTDAVMGRTHTMDRDAQQIGFTWPSCNTNTYDYYKKKGKYLTNDWKKKLAPLINKAKKAGKKAIGIRFSSEKYMDQALSYLGNTGKTGFGYELQHKYKFSKALVNKILKKSFYDKRFLLVYFSWQ